MCGGYFYLFLKIIILKFGYNKYYPYIWVNIKTYRYGN